jgi:type II secretory pathway component PulF
VNFWSAVPGILGDRLRLAMPILGDLFRKLSYAQFARAMALLLASGVPLVEAIENACRAVENLAARDHIMNLKRKVERGGTLSRALSEIPYFSSTFAWMVSCGEKREELPGMMMEIAEFYDREVKLSTSTGIRVIEPVGIIAVGLLFGLIVFAVFLPFYSLIGTMH